MKLRLVKKVVKCPWRYTGHQRKAAARYLLRQRALTYIYAWPKEDQADAFASARILNACHESLDNRSHLHPGAEEEAFARLEARILLHRENVEAHLPNADWADELEWDYDRLINLLCVWRTSRYQDAWAYGWRTKRFLTPRDAKSYRWEYRYYGRLMRYADDKDLHVVAGRKKEARETAVTWNSLRHVRG